MKLHKALKLKKKLAGEIAQLKSSIQQKNSFVEGSVNTDKYSVSAIYAELLTKIQDLVGLKYAINEANREIQSKIYLLSEYKGLIVFWNGVSVVEGVQNSFHGFAAATPLNYVVQFDELKRDEMVKVFQDKVDALQEEIDTFNYTTDIPWDDYNVKNETSDNELDGLNEDYIPPFKPDLEELKSILGLINDQKNNPFD